MSEKTGNTLTARDPRSAWSKFMSLNGSAVFLAMIAAIILFELYAQITRGGGGLLFMTPDNLMSILRQQVYIGLIAFGLTLVMITGNIDLSVGNMLTFTCCVAGTLMLSTNNGVLSIVGTIAVGTLCGLLNGVLVSYVKLNAFITTLGTSSIFTALAAIMSSGTVLVIPADSDPVFSALGTSTSSCGSCWWPWSWASSCPAPCMASSFTPSAPTRWPPASRASGPSATPPSPTPSPACASAWPGPSPWPT